jgi:hypothetical protein
LKLWEELTAYFPGQNTDRTENDALNNSNTVACVLVSAVMLLLSRCLATIGEYTCGHTDRWEGFMEYAAEMGSRVMIYITSSDIRKLTMRVHRHTDSMVIS